MKGEDRKRWRVMYISTREMVISIICNACGVFGLILWAIEAYKSNANQHFQDVESVEPMQTDDCLDNPLNKVKGSERLLKGKDEPQTDCPWK